MATLTTVTPASKRYPQRIGTRLEWEGKLTGTASYATGGDTVPLKLFGFNTAIEGGIVGASGGYVFELIPQADGSAKLKAWWTGPAINGVLAEVANATNLSAVTPFARVSGH